MPIKNLDDAREVRDHVKRVFAVAPDERAQAIRRLFVETLDFDSASGRVSLRPTRPPIALPETAERIASLDGVHVCYVALDTRETDRVRKAEAAAAARLLARELGDDLLLVFTNTSGSQLHFVHPVFNLAQPTLRRMIVERDLPRRTAVQQIANIYSHYLKSVDIRAALKSAFDVERVTDEFFAEYKRVFEDAEKLIIEANGDIEADWRLFVQTLYNRLMFVHFLSRKGWLTFDGNTDYLKALWRSYRSRPDETSFYHDRLRPLFFCGLNNPSSTDVSGAGSYMNTVYGKVPFLNGGLFEQTDLDRRTDIDVPDPAIEPLLRDRVGLFNRFNFTVMESTPFDIEVAVDPEMLGKAFEESVNGRHDTGSYYTPRPVVAFMCREALKGYLESRGVGLSPEAVRKFVDERDTSEISLNAAPQVSRALDEVTVVDPACGSGAYLLGMLQELVDLQTVLFNVGVDPRSLYRLKLHVIERNIYGVDNDDFAVNIAMLRLWLSLAIEYEGEEPEPLPNLDFKIVYGDSLRGPEPIYQLQVLRSKLGKLKTKYMHATAQADKDRLRNSIEAERARVEKALGGAGAPEGSINWRLDFAEVFETRDGFDIAIANPPYVRQEKIGPHKAALVRQYSDAASARSDLYCYFYARALQLLRRGGWHVFVCSNSWLDVGYGAKLQKFLLENAHVQAIYESAVERQFSTAQINTVISLIRNVPGDDHHITRFVSLRDKFQRALTDLHKRRERTVSQADLMAASLGSPDKRGRRKFVGDKWGGKYLRAPDIYWQLLEKSRAHLVPLGQIATVRAGMKSGANEFFYLTEEKICKWKIESQFVKPMLKSPSEFNTIIVDANGTNLRMFMCHESREHLRGTAALAYIEYGESQGYHSRRSCSWRNPWYDLGYEGHSKLAFGARVDKTARTFLVQEGLQIDKAFYLLKDVKRDPYRLCTVMNSTLTNLFLNVHGRTNFGGGLMEIEVGELEGVPIVDPDLIPEADTDIFFEADWDALSSSASRNVIDDILSDVLDLTDSERSAIHEGLVDLVQSRRTRARSLK